MTTAAQVSAVPMLVREQPRLVFRMNGDFSGPENIRRMLNAANPGKDVGKRDEKRNQE